MGLIADFIILSNSFENRDIWQENKPYYSKVFFNEIDGLFDVSQLSKCARIHLTSQDKQRWFCFAISWELSNFNLFKYNIGNNMSINLMDEWNTQFQELSKDHLLMSAKLLRHKCLKNLMSFDNVEKWWHEYLKHVQDEERIDQEDEELRQYKEQYLAEICQNNKPKCKGLFLSDVLYKK